MTPNQAINVTLSDQLPEASVLTWTIVSHNWGSCGIDAGDMLTCTADNISIGTQEVIVSASTTDIPGCDEGESLVLANSVTVEADNAGPVSDTGQITVDCSGGAGVGGGGDGVGTGTGGTPSGQPPASNVGGVRSGDSTGTTSNVAAVRGAGGAPRIAAGDSGLADMGGDGAWYFALGAFMAAMVGASALGFRRAIS